MIITYPWAWLADALGGVFDVRYPWVDEIAAAASHHDAACLLIPACAGRLDAWAGWLADLLDERNRLSCLRVTGDVDTVARTIRNAYRLDGEGAEWAQLLASCRRVMPHVDTVPLVIDDPDPRCTAAASELVDAQRMLGYPLFRPLLVRRTAPAGWRHTVVRFGVPQPSGNLHRIDPRPAQDPELWTRIVLALVAVWEAGAIPSVTEDLWDRLRTATRHSVLDPHFDGWLELQIDAFASARERANGLPTLLPFQPLEEIEDDHWQKGFVVCEDGRFDLVPLHGRRWAQALGADAREALRRRRLTNVPLARWISAWATSVEESLRVAALRAGAEKLKRFLEDRPARRQGSRSRWAELAPDGPVGGVDCADFLDLQGFITKLRPDVRELLDRCRTARNAVVHERRLRFADLIRITAAVTWLTDEGLL